MDTPPSGLPGTDELADCCRWIADAHAAGDPQQVVAGLCELYRLLTCGGWVPSQRSETLLRLHGAVVDDALLRLLP